MGLESKFDNVLNMRNSCASTLFNTFA